MIPAIKAEFRKLFTVRSTYVIFGLTFLLAVFFAFYVDGYKSTTAIVDPGKLASESISAIMTVSALSALVGILNVTHEYRYNTIMYTLVVNRSRFKVLFAKLFAVSCFAIVFSLFFAVAAPLLADVGIHVRGLHMVHQVIPVWSLLWRCAFAGWAMALFALLIAVIIRFQPGSVAAFFLIPGTLEPLIGLLLKKNAVYLPFSMTHAVLEQQPNQAVVSYGRAALITVLYLGIGWVIGLLLFTKRDAN